MRAKRATLTFWVDKRWLKMPKKVHFGEFLIALSWRSNSVTRQVSFNRTKIGGKCQNSNATFWVCNFQTMEKILSGKTLVGQRNGNDKLKGVFCSVHVLLPSLPSDFRGVGIRSFCAEWVTMYCHAATLYFLCFSFKNGVYIADDAALVDLSSLFVLGDYLPRYQTLNHLHNGWLENPYRKLHLLDYWIRKKKSR